jgi:hypothetical protein
MALGWWYLVGGVDGWRVFGILWWLLLLLLERLVDGLLRVLLMLQSGVIRMPLVHRVVINW